jgi:hypothetical protein
MPNASTLRVQFAHGLESSSQGNKAKRLLPQHFTLETPAMSTRDFESCVAHETHRARHRAQEHRALPGQALWAHRRSYTLHQPRPALLEEHRPAPQSRGSSDVLQAVQELANLHALPQA